MTCIIGYLDKQNDCVWMGCDSLGSNGYSKAIESTAKAFHNDIMKDVVIGGTTSFRHLDLLRYTDKLFDKVDKYERPNIDHKYMVTKFIPKVIDIFKSGIVHEEDKNKGSNFIVGVGNKLFEIQGDYSVLEPDDGICAVGCGGDIAMGSLHTSRKNNDMTIPEKIILALEAAEHISCGVQRPFRIINTKDDKEIIIEQRKAR